jgi:perosamine synthetase
LAVNGGQAVRETLLPYGRHEMHEEDIEAVIAVLRSDWITTGPKVAEFEDAVAAYVGAKFAVSFSSGTAALHGAVFATGLGPGDEAVTTPLTFCATANCLLYQGAVPVFADVSPDTLNLDPGQVARRLTSRTKALIPVDYAGHPADLGPLLELAERHSLTVIEDACHALGAQYKGRRVGSISHMTVFSFHPVKHITTGEGGMVTTDDRELAHRLRMFRNHGIESDAMTRQQEGQWYYEMRELGYNYRLPDFGCALGLSQLKRLESNLAKRGEIAARYTARFRGVPGLVPPVVREGVRPAWHIYPLRLDLARLCGGRSEIFSALRAEGIGVNVHYIPVHMHPYYRNRFGYRGGEYTVAEGEFERLITLPIFQGMQDRDAEEVMEAMEKVTASHLK